MASTIELTLGIISAIGTLLGIVVRAVRRMSCCGCSCSTRSTPTTPVAAEPVVRAISTTVV